MLRAAVEVGRRRRPSFATATRGSAKHTLGSSHDIVKRNPKPDFFFLTICNYSSLVIDTLSDEAGEAREGSIAVACFYFDFAAQKEQSATSTLGALLKQVVSGLVQIPQEIMGAFQKHKKAIGGRRLQLPEIVKLLGNLSSSRRTFFCLDALDECAPADRVKILLSIRNIIEMSPTTRVFMTGRPHIGGEMARHLPGGAAFISISP